MAAWPSGVAVVTAAVGGRPCGCTVTAVTSVSANPPLLLVSLGTASRTLDAIRHTGRFGVCVLSTRQRHLARSFATGEPAERFAGVAYDWVLGVPVLRGTVTGAVCAVEHNLDVADHVLVTGGPLWQQENPGATPVIWFQRDYWHLCQPAERR